MHGLNTEYRIQNSDDPKCEWEIEWSASPGRHSRTLHDKHFTGLEDLMLKTGRSQLAETHFTQATRKI